MLRRHGFNVEIWPGTFFYVYLPTTMGWRKVAVHQAVVMAA